MKALSALTNHKNTKNWARYRIFGFTVASNYFFDRHLEASEDAVDLFFTLVDEKPLPDAWKDTPPIYVSSRKNRDGENVLAVYNQDNYLVIRYARMADYYLYDQGIVCHLLDHAHQELMAIHISPAIFALWLELKRELFALHAAAVIIDGKAIGFLGDTGHGKSTLAAAFTQAHYPLLTDDILMVGEKDGAFFARPGYPTMRLWMNEAALFIEEPDNLDVIQSGYDKRRVPVGENNFGSFYDQIVQLDRIYIPHRLASGNLSTDIQIETIPKRDAVIELIRLAYSSRLSEALGRNTQRLKFFAHLAEAVPLARLVYPSEHWLLPTVRSAILDDLGANINPGGPGKLSQP